MEKPSKTLIIAVFGIVALFIVIGIFLVVTGAMSSYAFLMIGVAIGVIGLVVRLARGS